MKCIECKHFKQIRKGSRGGIYGRCKLKSHIDLRSGKNPACKQNERRMTITDKVCCNCRHNIRIKEVDGRIKCECDIDHSYIGYVACMTYKCRHWAKEKKSEGKKESKE